MTTKFVEPRLGEPVEPNTGTLPRVPAQPLPKILKGMSGGGFW